MHRTVAAHIMSDQWNDNLFDEFILLRDGLRAAKRDKNYQHVLSLGQQIIELNKSAQFLRIAPPIFLKDMGNACVKLGDNTAAIKYFKDAIEKLTKLKGQSEDWKKEIDVIKKKLEKLGGCPRSRF
jgi:tetratricopeptide (TPR) repeat protein